MSTSFPSLFRSDLLAGKKAIVLGVANERSLAWAIAQALHGAGATVGFTFQGEALERRVRPLADSLGSSFVEPCDVTDPNQRENLFRRMGSVWGGLDFLIHSVAFAPKEALEARFSEVSEEAFQVALKVSTYSLIALARAAEPFLRASEVHPEGGSIVTLSYYGAEKVVPNYHVMGVAKAALEASVRYLAEDLGPQKIRVNAISAGPVRTLAASGIKNFRDMLSQAAEKTPLRENIEAGDVGQLAAYLCSPGGAHITGSTLYVDSGAHIMGV